MWEYVCKVTAPSIDGAARMGQSAGARRARPAARLLACLLLSACVHAPLQRAALPTPPAQARAAPAAALGDNPAALVVAERAAASQRNLAVLAQLWDAGARIIETRAMAGPAAAYTWQGRAAILDRYVVAVFPSPPQPWGAAAPLRAVVVGDDATLQNGIDTWRFVRRAGRWWIDELRIDD